MQDEAPVSKFRRRPMGGYDPSYVPHVAPRRRLPAADREALVLGWERHFAARGETLADGSVTVEDGPGHMEAFAAARRVLAESLASGKFGPRRAMRRAAGYVGWTRAKLRTMLERAGLTPPKGSDDDDDQDHAATQD